MEFIIPSSLLLLTILLWACFHLFRPRRATKLPPGPPQLPIIGNIHQIGRNPHHTFTRLAKTYGPIIYLKLGCVDTVVVSSPLLAKELLQKHDQVLSSRHLLAISEIYGRDKTSILWLPTNALWRTLRRICKDHMFSLQSLDSSQGLRQQKLRTLRDYVLESCELGRVLDIADTVFTTTLNLISWSLFSMDLADFHSSDSSQQLKEIVQRMVYAVTAPNMADVFPVLKPFDPQRLKQKSAVYVGKLIRIFEGIIDQRLKSSSVDSKDLLKALLEITRVDESEFSRNDMLHLLLDLFVAGTATTTTTVEWAIAELIHNPEEMTKVRYELHTIIGKGQEIRESDISRLPYLRAVLKETFRLHPPGPLLIPHKATADIEINEEYIIPKNAQVMVNVWAMGRDPEIWSDPDCFNPGRFLGSKNSIDVRGQDFELIPFSSGRRMCPGLPLAYRMVHLLVATLIQEFDWKLEGGMKPEEMNMNDRFESTLKRVEPLRAIPVKV